MSSKSEPRATKMYVDLATSTRCWTAGQPREPSRSQSPSTLNRSPKKRKILYMKTRSNAEWERLYRLLWRGPFAHLPKYVRAKLVRGCRGKAVYESVEEALPVITQMPAREGLYLHAYRCPICWDFQRVDGEIVYRACYHIGNSRSPRFVPERAIDPKKTFDRLHESM
jgi:hypothetical protein